MSGATIAALFLLMLLMIAGIVAAVYFTFFFNKGSAPSSPPPFFSSPTIVISPPPSVDSGPPSVDAPSSDTPSDDNGPPPAVDVDLKHRSVVFGTYRSEEHEHWKEIYDPDKTLKPLGMKGHRIQLSIRHKSDAGDSAFHSVYIDEDDRIRFNMDESQKGILDLIKRACGGRVDDILVTIGLPKFKNHPKENLLGTAEWKKDWMSLCKDVADQLKGKCGIVEIFGEPDLDWLKTHYSHSGAEKIANAAGIAIDIFRAAGHKNVGGCGAGEPDKPWMDVFLKHIKPFNPDFISYHSYLYMHDSTPISGPPPRDVRQKHRALIDTMNRAGIPESTPIILSEYGFQEADFNKAIDVNKHTMTNYKNGARSLESWAIVHDFPRLSHVYVAQGVGQAYFNPAIIGFKPWAFSMYPMVIWDPKDGYKYRASYWAWAMLMKVLGGGDWKFEKGGDISRVVSNNAYVEWNRSGRAIKGTKGSKKKIDSKTFPYDFKNPDSIVKEASKDMEPSSSSNDDDDTMEIDAVFTDS